MATNVEPTEQRRNLGNGIMWVVASTSDPLVVGKLVEDLLAAALKAVAPGRQTNHQMLIWNQDARKAVARKLARRVKNLQSKGS